MKKKILIGVIIVAIIVIVIIVVCILSSKQSTVSSYNTKGEIISLNPGKLIIDRFEGDFAVCEDEDLSIININKSLIPSESEEGSVLILQNGSLVIDINETNNRRYQISEKLNTLFEQGSPS